MAGKEWSGAGWKSCSRTVRRDSNAGGHISSGSFLPFLFVFFVREGAGSPAIPRYDKSRTRYAHEEILHAGK